MAQTMTCLRDPVAGASAVLEAIYGGDAQAVARARAFVDECRAARGEKLAALVARFFLQHEPPARALEVIGEGPTANDANVFLNFWGPNGLRARRAPEFAGFARKVGLADLWDRYGAPDGCRRAGPGEYTCG